jgi:muramoyltetrapeptide carboxypeptidase LdcA involved in peptidoglycan recycling
LSIHDLGPGFIRAGLNEYSRLHPDLLTEQQARERFPQEFMNFFGEVRGIIEGLGSARRITGRLAAGALPEDCEATFVGGNLAVLVTLLGTPFRKAIDPAGRWLLIEDINESPERIDRRLAQLKLAGSFQRCAGLLVGDFREKDKDHQPAVLELLPFHLAPDRAIPIITTRDVGHVWPMAPLPLGRSVRMKRTGSEVEVDAFQSR